MTQAFKLLAQSQREQRINSHSLSLSLFLAQCERAIAMEMQQRPSSTASRLSEEQRVIIITPTEQPEAKRRRTNDDFDALPLYDPRSIIGKREISHSRSAEKWVHAIPVLVLFCIFILWRFSCPVTVLVEDGRITAIRQIDTSMPNDTRIDLTTLAVSATPIPLILQNLSSINEIDLNVVSAPIPPNLSSDNETGLHVVSTPN